MYCKRHKEGKIKIAPKSSKHSVTGQTCALDWTNENNLKDMIDIKYSSFNYLFYMKRLCRG